MKNTQADIRKMAKQGIDRADDTTVKMIPTMLKVRESETEQDAFDQQMLARINDYERGLVKGYNFEVLTSFVCEALANTAKPESTFLE